MRNCSSIINNLKLKIGNKILFRLMPSDKLGEISIPKTISEHFDNFKAEKHELLLIHEKHIVLILEN